MFGVPTYSLRHDGAGPGSIVITWRTSRKIVLQMQSVMLDDGDLKLLAREDVVSIRVGNECTIIVGNQEYGSFSDLEVEEFEAQVQLPRRMYLRHGSVTRRAPLNYLHHGRQDLEFIGPQLPRIASPEEPKECTDVMVSTISSEEDSQKECTAVGEEYTVCGTGSFDEVSSTASSVAACQVDGMAAIVMATDWKVQTFDGGTRFSFLFERRHVDLTELASAAALPNAGGALV
jgi:hypothetical protein